MRNLICNLCNVLTLVLAIGGVILLITTPAHSQAFLK